MVEDLCVGTMNDVLVGNAENAHGDGLFAKGFAHHSTQATKLRVFLDGNDTTSFLGGFLDGLLVEGLNPRAIQYAG